MTAYLDSAIFANHGGMPALVYGPVAENVHALDERVSLSSLLRVTKTVALFAANWCGVEERPDTSTRVEPYLQCEQHSTRLNAPSDVLSGVRGASEGRIK